MKRIISLGVTLLLASIAVSIAAPDKEAIIAKEKAAWQAFKDKKADDFRKLVSADLVAVYTIGILNMQKELDAMSKTDMKSFSLGDFNVVMTNADTAIVSYTAKVESSVEGKDNSGEYNCGSVWQMKNGQWQGIFHSDMKAETAAK